MQELSSMVLFKKNFKFETSRKKMKSLRTSFKQAKKKLEFGHRTAKNDILKSHTSIKKILVLQNQRFSDIYIPGELLTD